MLRAINRRYTAMCIFHFFKFPTFQKQQQSNISNDFLLSHHRKRSFLTHHINSCISLCISIQGRFLKNRLSKFLLRVTWQSKKLTAKKFFGWFQKMSFKITSSTPPKSQTVWHFKWNIDVGMKFSCFLPSIRVHPGVATCMTGRAEIHILVSEVHLWFQRYSQDWPVMQVVTPGCALDFEGRGWL